MNERFEEVKTRLREAREVSREITGMGHCGLPILHNDNKIILQFDGWAIELNENGTYYYDDDTTGG